MKSYKGATYTWDRLNRLKSCVKSNGTAEYTYNAEGQPEKTELDYGNGMVGTTEREYVNGRLYKESKILTMNGAEIVSATMQYLYRGEEVIGLIYNGSLYYYRKNLQGDIIEIVDEDGNVAATYKYDAWGNWTVSGGDVGTYNSFRYRGYYYDTAVMLYYLKTRYYDPETGRFISPDSINYLAPQSINGLNLYAYCLNNPVMYVDPTGESFILAMIIGGAIAGAIIGATVNGVTAYSEGVRGWDLAGAIVAGAAVGGIAGGIIGAGVGTLFGGAAVGGALAIAGGGTAAAGAAISASAAGTAVLTGLAAGIGIGTGILGVNILFSKGNGPRLGHNQYENKQIDSLCKQFNLTKEQRRILHEYITGQNLSYQEIKQIIIELFFS